MFRYLQDSERIFQIYRQDILGDEEDVDGVATDLGHAEEYVEQPSDKRRLGKINDD